MILYLSVILTEKLWLLFEIAMFRVINYHCQWMKFIVKENIIAKKGKEKMGKKKKIIIVLGVITAIITIAGMGGVLLTKINEKNENPQKIEKLLEREKNGKLKNGNMYEATDAMEALYAMIKAGI